MPTCMYVQVRHRPQRGLKHVTATDTPRTIDPQCTKAAALRVTFPRHREDQFHGRSCNGVRYIGVLADSPALQNSPCAAPECRYQQSRQAPGSRQDRVFAPGVSRTLATLVVLNPVHTRTPLSPLIQSSSRNCAVPTRGWSTCAVRADVGRASHCGRNTWALKADIGGRGRTCAELPERGTIRQSLRDVAAECKAGVVLSSCWA